MSNYLSAIKGSCDTLAIRTHFKERGTGLDLALGCKDMLLP